MPEGCFECGERRMFANPRADISEKLVDKKSAVVNYGLSITQWWCTSHYEVVRLCSTLDISLICLIGR